MEVPGDKSISHRRNVWGNCQWQNRDYKFLKGEDCLATLECFKQMGVKVEEIDDKIIVHGNGFDGLKEPADVLNMGNSGTTTRLLLGILSGCSFYSVLSGDKSLNNRPMSRVAQPLGLMEPKYGDVKTIVNYRCPFKVVNLKEFTMNYLWQVLK